MNAVAINVGAAHSGLRSLKRQKKENAADKGKKAPNTDEYLAQIIFESKTRYI
jgi:hypothetical protein